VTATPSKADKAKIPSLPLEIQSMIIRFALPEKGEIFSENTTLASELELSACQKPGEQSARKSSTPRTSSGYSQAPQENPFSANVSGAESSHLSATSGLSSRTSTIPGISSWSTARASRRSKSSMSGEAGALPKSPSGQRAPLKLPLPPISNAARSNSA
jgi:hypothetical protein